MKTTILVLFAIALPMFGGASKSDDEKAVLAAEKQLVDALLKANTSALEKLLGDDLVYTHSSAKTETKADVIQVIKSGATKYSSIEVNDTKVRQFGNVVITTGTIIITSVTAAGKNPPSKLLVTRVWAKQPPGWQLVSRQATKLPD